MLLAFSLWLIASDAKAYSFTFCMRWAIQHTDSNIGEDYYLTDTIMKARGAKVDVFQGPNGGVFWGTFYANETNGCFTVNSTSNAALTLNMYAESRIGGSNNITIKAFPSIAAMNSNTVPFWSIAANPGGSGTFYYNNTAGVVSNLIAWGTFSAYWVDQATSPRLSGTRTMRLVSAICAPTGEGSCMTDVGIGYIQPGAEQKKFLVGHEVGHWTHSQWMGSTSPVGLDYSPNSSDPDCAFSGVGDHALRSKEYANEAFVEGFAQYLSTLAYNNYAQTDAWFKYYKNIAAGDTDGPAYADLRNDNWKVNVEDGFFGDWGGPSNWQENMCFWTDGRSEMDWQRFYWDYRTNTGHCCDVPCSAATPPTHYQIFRHLEYTFDTPEQWGHSTAWDQFADTINNHPALGQSSLVSRWNLFSNCNGIDQ